MIDLTANIPFMLLLLMTSIVGATTMYSLWMTARALRAKKRAYFALHSNDGEIKKIAEILKRNQINPEDLERMSKIIEARLAARLSQEDQEYISQGLHQYSKAGARRYMQELAGA